MAKNNIGKYILKYAIALAISVVVTAAMAIGFSMVSMWKDYYSFGTYDAYIILSSVIPMGLSLVIYSIWQLSNTFRKKIITDGVYKTGKTIALILSTIVAFVSPIVIGILTLFLDKGWIAPCVFISAGVYAVLSVVNVLFFGSR